MLAGLSLVGPPWMQWLLFSLLSIVTLSLFRRPLLKRLRPATMAQEVDSLVGETAIVLEDMAAGAIGKVELRGSAWSARNVSGLSADKRSALHSREGRWSDALRADLSHRSGQDAR